MKKNRRSFLKGIVFLGVGSFLGTKVNQFINGEEGLAHLSNRELVQKIFTNYGEDKLLNLSIQRRMQKANLTDSNRHNEIYEKLFEKKIEIYLNTFNRKQIERMYKLSLEFNEEIYKNAFMEISKTEAKTFEDIISKMI